MEGPAQPPPAPASESGHVIARRLVRSALLVVLVFAIGVLGYLWIGAPDAGLLDAVYMTVITLTTVGYGEVIDLSGNPAGRVFTVLLLVMGVGAFLNFFSTITAFMVEGSLQRLLRKRRMDRSIERLHDHTIVCGGGFTGRHVVRELLDTERAFVLVDNDAERVERLYQSFETEFPVVIGDATEDASLLSAGVKRASGLVACVQNDKDNLMLTLSARLLNPSLRIVCRCINESVEAKILRAGADAVVSPNRIGGLRMISELVRPVAVNFLDMMLRDRQRNLRVESLEIHAGSELADSTVASLRRPEIPDILLLALQLPDGSWHHSPKDDERLRPGFRLVFVGEPAARELLEALAGGPGQ